MLTTSCSDVALQLASIPNDVKRYSAEVTETIDRHVDHAATVLRDALSRNFPSVVRGSSRDLHILNTPPPRSVPARVYDWALRNRAWTGALIAFFGTGGLLLFGSSVLDNKKRKARRAGNGARKEIVGM